MKIQFVIAFVLYFCALFAIGLLFRKKNATSSDMLLGSRGLNYWVTALSAQASDMSSWLFMAFPMSIFLHGMPKIWIGVGLLIGMYACWQFVAPKLRVETEKSNSYTLPTFFARRLHDTTGALRVTGAILTLLFMTYYLAAGIIAIGMLFESVFQIDYYVGIIIATIVILGLPYIGGFTSVAWTELFQAIFLIGAIAIVPILAFSKIDGIAAIKDAASKGGIPLTLFSGKSSAITDILHNVFGWGLGYFGMPHIVTKFMGIKDPKELNKSKYLGITWEFFALAFAACVGFVGIAYFNGRLENAQLVFIEMVKELFHPFTGGLVLCGVMMATISTMNSQILVAASVMTEDIYKQLMRKNATSKQEVKVFRISVLLVAAVAFWISLSRSATIMDTVYFAWAGLGSSFGPLILASLYSKFVTRQGALAGILTGGLITALWPVINRYLSDHHIMGPVLAMIPGFALGLLMIFVVSACTQSQKIATSPHQ